MGRGLRGGCIRWFGWMICTLCEWWAHRRAFTLFGVQLSKSGGCKQREARRQDQEPGVGYI